MSSAFGNIGTFGRRPARAPAPSEPAAPRDRRPRLLGEPVDSLPETLPEVKRGRRRRITVIGEEVLHHPCADVTELGTKDLRALIDDMHATNRVANGVGLAANQIGVDARVFVYDCPDTWKIRHVGHVVNPVIVERDDETETAWEGCLSVPGGSTDLARPVRAVVEGTDQRGNPLRIEGHGLFARCLIHETEHLQGTLYVDHLKGRARRAALREMETEKDATWALWDERARELGK